MDSNWNLLGHEWAVGMLKQHLIRDSVRHAYLFTGPSGVGRRTLALRFSQALNCQNPPTLGEPCGLCKTCQQIERMQYPDLAVVQAEREGGTLSVGQVRAVRQSLVLNPYQGNFRVALFLRFQEANPSAANALLKTLEEAPAHAILLLTADNAELLLPTIVSRCEVLRLRPSPVDALEAYLKERGATAETARLLAHISCGRPGYALRLMDNENAMGFRRKRLDDLQTLLRSTRRERFAYAEKLTDRRNKNVEAEERLLETLLQWLSFWRDVFIMTAKSDAPLANVDRSAEVESLAAKLSLTQARRLVSDAEGAIEKLGRNVNSRLLAEVLLLDWPHVKK
jgi:DNA polymerase-3 subunit delta'